MMMRRETILTNAQVVTPEEVLRGTVQVTDGLIHAFDRGKSALLDAEDLEGDYLLPGLIELHTDHLEKQFTPRPGIRWPSIAAMLSHDASVVAAGITTVFDALAVGDVSEDSSRLRDLQDMAGAVKTAQKQGVLRSEHLLHIRCEIAYPHVIDLFEDFSEDPLVKLVSLMDHTPGQRQFTKMEKFLQYYKGKYHLADWQMEGLILRRQENQKKYATRHRALLVKKCRDLGIPLASHDDATVDHIREAASDGIVVSEFPTTLEAARSANRYGLTILMGAPNLVLGGSHSGNISALELGKLGLLDILSSDYVPGSLIQGVFLLHDKLDMPLPQAVALVTVNPAGIVGLQDRGTIQVGKRADLIRVKMAPGLPIIKKVWRYGRNVF
jgi:alpha-D-ribose 1-methylphosphonate 5-triphosphate diphosphatase